VLIVAQIFAVLAAVLHVVFFVFESVLWTRPAVFGRFGIASQEDANTIRPMAYNQGFYNLALAIGVIVGVILIGMSGDAGVVGKTLVIFGTACMALAGIILLTTGRKYLPSAAIQFVPAAVALVLTAFSTVG
jgi:putative membrane protein